MNTRTPPKLRLPLKMRSGKLAKSLIDEEYIVPHKITPKLADWDGYLVSVVFTKDAGTTMKLWRTYAQESGRWSNSPVVTLWKPCEETVKARNQALINQTNYTGNTVWMDSPKWRLLGARGGFPMILSLDCLEDCVQLAQWFAKGMKRLDL